MSTERELKPYLSTLATSIEVPAGNLEAIRARADQRRRIRRGGLSALAAVAVLGGALGVVNLNQDEPASTVASEATPIALTNSGFDWTVVTPTSGMGWAFSTARGADDALYALSTAPGPIENEAGPATLYRSADGIEWTPVGLPTDLSPTDVTGGGSNIYAIGTAPAGGSGMSVRLAQLGDGDSVTTTDLPIDLAAIEARLEVQLNVGQLHVATSGSRVLVTVGLFDRDGIQRFLEQAGIDANGGYSVTETGVDVYAAMNEPDNTDESSREPQAASREEYRPDIIGSYTFAELGIDGEALEYVLGRTHMFLAEADDEFVEVDPPTSGRTSDYLVGTSTGFTYVSAATAWPTPEATTVWSSTNGTDWALASIGTQAGYVSAVSTYRDQAALVLSSNDQTVGSTVFVQQTSGVWSSLNVIDAVRRSGVDGDLVVGASAVGPLGVAVAVLSLSGDESRIQGAYLLVTNGVTASVTDLSAEGFADWPQSVSVTADAVIVTGLTEYKDNEPDTVRPLQLLVGTPTR